MGRRRMWMAGLTILACLVVAGVVSAQTSSNYDLSWHVLGGAGSESASANHQVRGTLGQLAIGLAQSDEHTLGGGYWYGMKGIFRHRLYLPIVLRSVKP
jgi:hypothetical protein